jgi:hypothetical protein
VVPERPGDMDERDVDARFASIIARWDGPVPAADEDPGAAPRADAVAAPPVEPTAPAPDGVNRAGVDADDVDADGGDADSGDADSASAESAAAADTTTPEAEADAEPSPPAPGTRSPWVNPSPLDLVVPPSAWRASEPTDPAKEAAASAAEAALEDEHFEPPEVTLPPQEDLHFWGAVIGLVAGPLMLLYVVFARPFHSTRWFVAAVLVSLVGFALLVLRQPKHRDPTSGDNGARI